MRHALKLISIATMVLWSSLTVFAAECTAPESVKKVAKLLEDTFKGTAIACDDGSSFATQFKFECKGSEYFDIRSPDDIVELPDGRKVFLVSKFSEKDGVVVMTELTFADHAAYVRGDKPTVVTPTNFIALSERSFSFYSKAKLEANSWISSVWYIPEGQTKAMGYKLYAHKSVSCKED